MSVGLSEKEIGVRIGRLFATQRRSLLDTGRCAASEAGIAVAGVGVALARGPVSMARVAVATADATAGVAVATAGVAVVRGQERRYCSFLLGKQKTVFSL